MTVTYKQYSEDKKRFFEKHNYDYKVDTSSMDEYGTYSKVYCFEDNAQWCEVMRPVYRKVTTVVELVEVTVDVKLFETEYWSTEAGSKYYYEKF